MTTLGRHNPKSGVSSSWQSSQLEKQFPWTKFSKNVFSTKNVFHAIKIVFARKKSFLRWVDKKYFSPMGHVGRAPRGPLPEDSRFPDFAVSPTLPHFPHFCAFSATFCNFPPLKTLWDRVFYRPLSRRSLPDSRPGSGPPGPTFRLCRLLPDQIRKKRARIDPKM